MKPTSATALMFFNCWQRACETCTSKATPIMIRWKHWYFYQVIGVPATRLSVLTIRNGISKSSKGTCGRTTPRRQHGDSELVEAAHGTQPRARRWFLPPARHVSGDRLADAPFTISIKFARCRVRATLHELEKPSDATRNRRWRLA